MVKSNLMLVKPQLFGTDGVRGKAGEYPLDPATVARLAWALCQALQAAAPGTPLQVVIGEDTRESSPWIADALAAGLRAGGAVVRHAGVITTPGIAFLTRHHQFSAGVMVSASHNPYQDNGIKVLSPLGAKMSQDFEMQVENWLESPRAPAIAAGPEPLPQDSDLVEDYLAFLARLAPASNHLARIRLVVDCANGASSALAGPLFHRLGVRAELLNAQPNGQNINLDCGSLHPQAMAAATQALGADLGVAFDGDADRAIFATSQGKVVNGDHVLFAMGPYLKAHGELKGDAVVGTLMTNLGLELALRSRGIALKRTDVGDKFVLEEMLRSGINLGGEPSGHIIFADVSLAGDGLVTLLEILRLISETGEDLQHRLSGLKQFPQVIRNVRVRSKPSLDSLPGVQQAIRDCNRECGERGRVVVRYSGTETLARVMVEAEDGHVVERHAELISRAIQAAIGDGDL